MSDDSLHSLSARVDQLERHFRSGSQTLVTIEGSLNIMKTEHEHLREMLDLRLKAVEKAQETQSLKMDQMLQSLSIISAEVDKSPLGRALKEHILALNEKLGEQEDRQTDMTERIEHLSQWQTKVDGTLNGVLGVVKWLGITGIIALIAAIIKLVVTGHP